MKKIFLLLIMSTALLLMAACGGGGGDSEKAAQAESETAAQAESKAKSGNKSGIYRVIVKDEAGNPVKGVMVQFCSDQFCQMGMTDNDGIASYPDSPEGRYHAKIFKVPESITVSVKDISKHGSVVLDTTFEELKANDIEVGDIVTLFVDEKKYDLPVGTAYSDVDSGKMICRFDTEDNEVAVGINMGSFAKESGIGEKQTIEADPGYKWEIKIPELGLMLKEKKGFLDEYSTRNLTRTDAREDYPEQQS